MKAVAVNGSPRKGGNTEILLRKVLEPLSSAGWETEFIQLGGKKIRGCTACYRCFDTKDGRCSVKMDVFNDCLEKMLAAHAIILGTPTYFTDVSAEMKALLDRAGLVGVANDGLLRGKIGAAVVAVRRGGGTHAFDTINHMFLMSGAIIPDQRTGTSDSAWRRARSRMMKRVCGTWKIWVKPSPGWARQ